MKEFSFEITTVVPDDEDVALDSAVMVELPDGLDVSEDQLATLTKRVAGVIGDYLRGIYNGADITVCT